MAVTSPTYELSEDQREQIKDLLPQGRENVHLSPCDSSIRFS